MSQTVSDVIATKCMGTRGQLEAGPAGPLAGDVSSETLDRVAGVLRYVATSATSTVNGIGSLDEQDVRAMGGVLEICSRLLEWESTQLENARKPKTEGPVSKPSTRAAAVPAAADSAAPA